MEKINFLKFLSLNKFEYLLLSDNSLKYLRNQKKDLDLFIPSYQKKKFEKLISRIGFVKRIETIQNYPARFFYYNIKNIEKFNLDVMYEISFCKDYIFKKNYNYTRLALDSRIKKNNIFLTSNDHLTQIRSIINKKRDLNNFRNFFLELLYNNHIKLCVNANYILFLGSDGTGKTTIIQNLQKKLKIKSISYYFGLSDSGWVLKLNRWFFNNLFLKKIKINIYFLLFDFILRRIKMLRYTNNKLVLIDRFPGFVFLNNNFANKLIKIFLPKPNLVILLFATYKTLKKRKPNELKNDQQKWELVTKSLKCETMKLSTSYFTKTQTIIKIKNKIFSNIKYINNVLKKCDK